MFFGVLLAGFIGLDEGGGTIAVPLLATQILWINLLTDSAPALAMGVDPPPDDVMQQPPRSLADRIIDVPMWRDILWIGFVMSVVTLIALDTRVPGGFFGGSGDIVHGRTMAFTTLVIAQLFNTFNARSDHRSAFHHMFTNPLLWAAIAFAFLLQVVVVQIPFFNEPFGTTPLPLGDWLLCTALASGVLWAEEIRKVARYLLRRRRPA